MPIPPYLLKGIFDLKGQLSSDQSFGSAKANVLHIRLIITKYTSGEKFREAGKIF
jgi:hypothetical protein